jgi:hypothetical protein
MDDGRKDIQTLDVPNWETLAQDRRRWKELVGKAKTLYRVVEPNEEEEEKQQQRYLCLTKHTVMKMRDKVKAS